MEFLIGSSLGEDSSSPLSRRLLLSSAMMVWQSPSKTLQLSELITMLSKSQSFALFVAQHGSREVAERALLDLLLKDKRFLTTSLDLSEYSIALSPAAYFTSSELIPVLNHLISLFPILNSARIRSKDL